MSKLLTMQGPFFVSNNDSFGYCVVLHNPCDTLVESGQLSETPVLMRLPQSDQLSTVWKNIICVAPDNI